MAASAFPGRSYVALAQNGYAPVARRQEIEQLVCFSWVTRRLSDWRTASKKIGSDVALSGFLFSE